MAAAAEAAEGHSPGHARSAVSLHSTAGSAAATQVESATSTMRTLPMVKVKSTENKILDSATRLEERERKHLNSIGKQVNSIRATQPDYSFGPVVFPACRATVPFRPVLPSHEDRFGLRPQTTPGPKLIVSFPPSPTAVLKGFGMEPRFQGMEGPKPLGRSKPAELAQQKAPPYTIHPPVTTILHSTQASPFSQTYPYQEIRMTPRQLEDSHGSLPPGGSIDSMPSRLEPLNNSSTGVIARWEIRYPKKPSWSFGSSGMGSRFRKGTKFSRQAMVPTTALASERPAGVGLGKSCGRWPLNWKELRDKPAKMSPKNGTDD